MRRGGALAGCPSTPLTALPEGPGRTLTTALAGGLVDHGGLAAQAADVAARQRSPETRRTYAAVYRAFAASFGPDAAPADLTPEAVRAYRDALERGGRSPATVAKHRSALRGLAEPRALTHDEWARLLLMPDRRPAKASATSRCCTCSAPPACDTPKPHACT